jgi:hypothetical protein
MDARLIEYLFFSYFHFSLNILLSQSETKEPNQDTYFSESANVTSDKDETYVTCCEIMRNKILLNTF